MADDIVSNPGSGGATFRAFSDGSRDWPASVISFTTGGSAGAWTLQQVTSSTGLPVSVLGTATISGTVTANAGTGTFTVTDASLELTQGSTTSGQKGPLIQGAVTTAAPSYTTAQTSPLSLTTAGALRVDGSAVTQPVSGTVTANQGGTWTVQPGNTANTTPWLATINQGGNSASVTASNALKVDGSAVTQPVSGTITANLAAGTNTIGNVVPVAGTSGGATPYHLVSAASTNATSLKASAGTVYSVSGYNLNASPRYLKFFNKASAPTLGTDTPVHTYMMPGNTSGAGFTLSIPVGMSFATGIAFAVTGGIADSDSTAVGASDCVINIDYA